MLNHPPWKLKLKGKWIKGWLRKGCPRPRRTRPRSKSWSNSQTKKACTIHALPRFWTWWRSRIIIRMECPPISKTEMCNWWICKMSLVEVISLCLRPTREFYSKCNSRANSSRVRLSSKIRVRITISSLISFLRCNNSSSSWPKEVEDSSHSSKQRRRTRHMFLSSRRRNMGPNIKIMWQLASRLHPRPATTHGKPPPTKQLRQISRLLLNLANSSRRP